MLQAADSDMCVPLSKRPEYFLCLHIYLKAVYSHAVNDLLCEPQVPPSPVLLPSFQGWGPGRDCLPFPPPISLRSAFVSLCSSVAEKALTKALTKGNLRRGLTWLRVLDHSPIKKEFRGCNWKTWLNGSQQPNYIDSRRCDDFKCAYRAFIQEPVSS